ncbi:TnpV protein [Ruminococcus sp.]|uniref:TnpV protein n=1 Tax=Ruminococcus sp. TaxID=41978 RepID=UPI003A8CD7B4
MNELKPRIHENGIDYILVGDYYVPDLKLPEEKRPIGHWGRLHKAYLQNYRPAVYNELVLSCRLHSVLADLNEQANDRFSLIMEQMARAEGVTEQMKAENQMLWVQSMNSIRNRAEEIVKHEMIYCHYSGGGD